MVVEHVVLRPDSSSNCLRVCGVRRLANWALSAILVPFHVRTEEDSLFPAAGNRKKMQNKCGLKLKKTR
jgi:hypothetical protein